MPNISNRASRAEKKGRKAHGGTLELTCGLQTQPGAHKGQHGWGHLLGSEIQWLTKLVLFPRTWDPGRPTMFLSCILRWEDDLATPFGMTQSSTMVQRVKLTVKTCCLAL